MSLKTKIIIGVLIAAVGAAAYYFLLYKPKKDKEKGLNTVKSADTSAGALPTGTAGRLIPHVTGEILTKN